MNERDLARGLDERHPFAGKQWVSSHEYQPAGTGDSEATYGTKSGVSPLATSLSVTAGNVVALVLERHSKYGSLNITNTPGGALNGIVVRLYDKLARLAHSDKDFGDESVQDTINDIIGYGLIASLVHEGKWPK